MSAPELWLGIETYVISDTMTSVGAISTADSHGARECSDYRRERMRVRRRLSRK